MNDADVLFPWEKNGGDSERHGPERSEVDADAMGAAVDGEPQPDRTDDVTLPAADAPSGAGPDAGADAGGTGGKVADASAGDDPGSAGDVPVGEGAGAVGDIMAGDGPGAASDAAHDNDPGAVGDVTAGAAAGGDAVAELEAAPAAADSTSAAPASDDAGGRQQVEATGAPDADDEARFEVLDTEYARQAAERASAALREKPIAQKEYYSISEVCELVGLKPHVLRYWETQFQVLNPSKNRSGNRVYQRKEIRLITLVKHLLYEEKYTVEGAKAKLDRLRRSGELADTSGAVLDRAMIDQLRADLSELTSVLTPPART